jgi:hypothetical protein
MEVGGDWGWDLLYAAGGFLLSFPCCCGFFFSFWEGGGNVGYVLLGSLGRGR